MKKNNAVEPSCKKACKGEEASKFVITWDQEVSDEVRKIKAWIEASALIITANLILLVGTIVSIILKK